MRVEQDFAGHSWIGARERQEDAYAFAAVCEKNESIEKLLIVVADGMGGHAGGQFASGLAVDVFVQTCFEHEFSPASDDTPTLYHAMQSANEALAKALDDKKEGAEPGMGTTLLAATVGAKQLQWISVGDSPMILWRNGCLHQMNASHSGTETTVTAQGQTIQRPVLISALTGGTIPKWDFSSQPFPLQTGDILLGASDGVNILNDENLARIFSTQYFNANTINDAIIDAAQKLSVPNQDNLTIAVVRCS